MSNTFPINCGFIILSSRRWPQYQICLVRFVTRWVSADSSAHASLYFLVYIHPSINIIWIFDFAFAWIFSTVCFRLIILPADRKKHFWSQTFFILLPRCFPTKSNWLQKSFFGQGYTLNALIQTLCDLKGDIYESFWLQSVDSFQPPKIR